MLDLIGLSPLAIVVASLIAIFAALIQGAVGFGKALIGAPLLLLIDPAFIPGPLLVAGLLLTILIVARDHEGIVLSNVGLAIVGNVPGSAVGAVVLGVATQEQLSTLIGVLILLAVLISASTARIRPTRWSLLAAGATSGFTGTVSSIGGPPLALLLQNESGQRLRGTLAGYFIPAIVIALIAVVGAGRFGAREAGLAGVLAVPTVIGFLLSSRIARFVDRGRTRLAVLTLSGIAAVAVIVKALLG